MTIKNFSLAEITNIQEIPSKIQIRGYSDDTNPFIPNKDDKYVFRKDLIRYLSAFLSFPEGDGLFITGPTGSGKTSLITEFAARLNWPVQQITAHGRMELSDLIGFHTLVSESAGDTPTMKFMYGPLATAMKYGHILLINEIDLADPAEMAGLNDILEGRPLVISQNAGEIIQPHPMFRIVVTGNSVGSGDATGLYQGVLMQNLASMDRYRFMEVGYTDDEIEMSILDKVAPSLPKSIKEGMVRIANEIRRLFMGNDDHGSQISLTMSTRTLVRWAKLSLMFNGAPNPMAEALNQTLLIRSSAEEKEAITRIAKDVFGDLWT